MPTVGVMLFATAWAVAVAGFAFIVLEGSATARFAPWAYSIGPSVLRARRQMRPPPFRPGADIPEETVTGWVRILGPMECLFHPRRRDLEDVQWPFTLFPRALLETLGAAGALKGVIRWGPTAADIEVRLSLGVVIFTAAWAVGVAIWSVLAMQTPDMRIVGFVSLIGGWAFMGASAWFSLRHQRRQAQRIIDELDQWFRRAAA